MCRLCLHRGPQCEVILFSCLACCPFCGLLDVFLEKNKIPSILYMSDKGQLSPNLLWMDALSPKPPPHTTPSADTSVCEERWIWILICPAPHPQRSPSLFFLFLFFFLVFVFNHTTLNPGTALWIRTRPEQFLRSSRSTSGTVPVARFVFLKVRNTAYASDRRADSKTGTPSFTRQCDQRDCWR
ncbi:hypothetical protein MPTK1_5g14060 [Marchantia polymorpha subsp. ruderalis]|uniref:Uncharacterized protein n=2 Tax=Marchantia polymorpha TaxID=3197 RepID=A0AAF6BI62_MARPO|nr:hypothetical protein MARPO_0032s0096 [Marchantia polymorpha]BBN11696.1 hypothetical protein Mp_5g14060 [Marchantia polymorpha subsp. ruderalis]|eukprot:PTQ41910.1 hypothetical protein MARPO_0032s0096 [Marchantia polymorpha]